MFIILYIIFLFLLILFYLKYFYKLIILGQAPFISTKKAIISKIIDNVDVSEKKVVYELGSGIAPFLREIERISKENKLVAIEYSFIPFLFSKILFFLNKSKIKLIKKNLYKVNLHEANIIYLYLMPKMMSKLAKKIKRECKKGTIIISNSFKLKGLFLVKQIKISNTNIYYYKIK